MTPALYPAIPSTGGFTLDSGGKRVPAAVTNFHHTVPPGVANFLQRVRMLLRPCSSDTAAHRGKCGRNCLGLNDRGEMDSSLSTAYQNPAGAASVAGQSPVSSLCPSALGPQKVGPGLRPELRPAYSRTRCLPHPRVGRVSLLLWNYVRFIVP